MTPTPTSTDTIDRATLPPLFLPLVKAQARIDHDEEDLLVLEQIAQAIDDVERATNATIFERTITVAPPALGWPAPLLTWATPGSGNWISLPFNNVSALVVTDPDGVDVSASYLVRQNDPGGVGTALLQGPSPPPLAPVVLAFTAGMRTLEAITPSLRRAILRRAAALYEFREAALPLTADDLEPGLWRPDL